MNGMTKIPLSLTIGMILLFIVIVLILWPAFNKIGQENYEKIAYTNAKKLSEDLNKFCSDPTINEMDVSIYLPQDVRGIKTWLKPIFYPYIFYRYGDPKFLIYYEYFPVLEDEAWTIYIGKYAKLPIMTTADSPQNLEEKIKGFFDDNNDVEIIAPNIARSKSNPDKYILITNVLVNDSPIGKWSDGEFIVNFWNMSLAEKVYIKYFPCGANSLCLKTYDKLYSFPLYSCKTAGYEYIELNRGTTAIKNPDFWGEIWNSVKDKLSLNNINNFNPRFYVASPCKVKFKVTKDKCKCDLSETTPIFFYNKETGEYYKLGYEHHCGKIIYKEKDNKEATEVNCLKLTPYEVDGFCYTSPHYFRDLISNILNSNTAVAGGVIAGVAVKITTGITVTNPIVGTIISAVTFGLRAEGFRERYSWAWPSHPKN